MLVNLIVLVVLLALAVLFGWLVTRAWRSSHRILRWPFMLVTGLLMLLFAFVFVVGSLGLVRANAAQSNPVSDVKVAGTPEQIARGQKLAIICEGCHSSTGQLPLDGSTESFAGPLGNLYPPNLTPAGEVKNWSDGEIIRAIREGVHKSGRPLYVMPSENFHNLSDDDVQSLVAYLRSQQPVPHVPQTDTPSNGMGILGLLVVGLGGFPSSAQPPITQPVTAPAAGTAEYGQYLVNVIGCRSCHGANLGGGQASPFGGPPVGPNLTVLIPKWSEADFVKTIRTGTDPYGHTLNDQMPWKQISAFSTDEDLHALYLYLHGLTPVQ